MLEFIVSIAMIGIFIKIALLMVEEYYDAD